MFCFRSIQLNTFIKLDTVNDIVREWIFRHSSSVCCCLYHRHIEKVELYLKKLWDKTQTKKQKTHFIRSNLFIISHIRNRGQLYIIFYCAKYPADKCWTEKAKHTLSQPFILCDVDSSHSYNTHNYKSFFHIKTRVVQVEFIPENFVVSLFHQLQFVCEIHIFTYCSRFRLEL